MKLRLYALALFVMAALMLNMACAQTPGRGALVQGVAENVGTLITPVTITTGGTFQQVLPSIIGTSTRRQALTIQNNNTSTDNCWVFLGATASATAAKSILLQPGQAYTRYWPYVPSDAIQVTCASNNDTMYVDNQ